MFEISDDAKELILARLEDAMEGRPELRRGARRIGLRLNLQRGRAHLSLAFPRSIDRVIAFMGLPLLIVDPADFSRLESTCLIVEQGANGNTLSLEPRTTAQTP